VEAAKEIESLEHRLAICHADAVCVRTDWLRDNGFPGVADAVENIRKHTSQSESDSSNAVRMCAVCGRPMTQKVYEHAEDKRTYWTCDLAEGAWAHGAQHTAEDAPENRKR
jgi:hypothetical protein